MEINEKAKISLEIDDSEATTRFQEINTRLQEIKTSLKGVEQGSDAWKALKIEQNGLNTEMKELKHNIDVNNASMNELKSALSYWTKEANHAKVGTEEWIEATKKVSEIKTRIDDVKGEMKSLGNVVDEQSNEGGGMWSRLKKSMGGAFDMFVGGGLLDIVQNVMSSVWQFGVDSVAAFTDADQSAAQLEASLKSTGGAAGLTLEELNKLATDRMAVTVFDDDDIIKSEAMLLTFTDIKKGIYEEAIPAILDMATKMGGDSPESLQSTTIQVGKALNDPIKGITALSRVGVTFTEGQKDVIKHLVETGDKAGAQALILAELNKEFGGSAEAAANAATGGFKQFENVIGNVKETVGGLIMEGLNELLRIGKSVIEWFKEAWDSSSKLGDIWNTVKLFAIELFKSIYNIVNVFVEVLGQVWKVVDSFIGLSGAGNVLDGVLNAIRNSFKVVATVIMGVLTAVGVLADGFNILMNKGKELVNFFSPGTFKIDASATFDNLQKNAEGNFSKIKDLWVETTNSNVKKNKSAIDLMSDDDKKSLLKKAQDEDEADAKSAKDKAENAKKAAAERAKEREQEAKARIKDEADAVKSIEDMQVKAIANEDNRKIAEISLQARRQEDAIKKSMASEATKHTQLMLLEKETEDKIAKVQDDARKKKEKAEQDTINKVAKWNLDAETDTTKKKIKEIELRAKTELDDAKKMLAAKEITQQQFATREKQINDKKVADIADVEKKARDDKAKADQKERDDKLKKDKQLLDDDFKQYAEQAKLDLALTKNTAQAQFDAKMKLARLEFDHKKALLELEAEANREKVRKTISNETEQKNQIDKINTELNNKLRTEEIKLQADKVKAQKDANDIRHKNNQEFFKALDGLAQGDMNGFLGFLKSKMSADKAANNEQLKNASEKTNQIGEIALAGINALIKLNTDYTNKQLANLTKEKNANIAKLDADFKAGKLNADELAKEKDRANQEYDAKEKTLKREAFERNKKLQIASALIAGSMAVLSALATPPFPLGLAMAVIAGVKTAIDINKIKKTTFEGRSGGVFRNAGVAQGGLHGSKYGEAGIAMIDRVSGNEVGEIEGGEPVMVLSRNTYANNGPVIDKLLHSSLHRNGEPITLQNGGILPLKMTDMYYQKSYALGGVITRRSYEDGGMVDTTGDVDLNNSASPEATAAIEENKQVSLNTQKNTEETAKNTAEIVAAIQTSNGLLEEIKNKPSGISLHDLDNAVNRAVYSSNRSNL